MPAENPRPSSDVKVTPTIGRPVQAGALQDLQKQLVNRAGEYGYAVRRLTVAPHAGYLAVQELLRINQTLPNESRRYRSAAGLAHTMRNQPTAQEVYQGIHPTVAGQKDIVGGLVLSSVRKTGNGVTLRRLILELEEPAEDAGLRIEALAVRARLTGEAIHSAAAAKLPAIAIPIANISRADERDLPSTALRELLHADWDIPNQITLGPLEAVPTSTAPPSLLS